MQKEHSLSSEIHELKSELLQIKDRLTKLESAMEIASVSPLTVKNKAPQPVEEEFEINLTFKSKDTLEYSVGEYGMAWIGNIILFFGIAFLVGYLQKVGNPLVSVLVGLITVSAIYACSYFIRNSYSYLAKLLSYTGHLLLYYIALRLHYFQENPLISNDAISFLILFSVSTIIVFISYLDKKQLLAGLGFLMMLITGVVSRNILASAATIAIIAALSVYLYYRFGWLKLVFVYIFLLYLGHLNWLLSNPFLGKTVELVASPNGGYIFFIATGFIFSLIALIPKKENISNDFITASIVWNGLGFTFILALIIVTYFIENYVPIMGSVTLFCLLYAVILKIKSPVRITASMYVLYGFLALSVAIYGIFGFPNSYALFALQSLLVVSMALWFRSKFMTVMNTLLFLTFMAVYLKTTKSNNIDNFSFMLVALVSARIINWKKERLNIKTEMVRNLYLVAGFTMTLISFYHAFPEKYVSASWILAAILFFILSILLKNIKYRWIAIATMIASAIRLIFVDMSNINIGYRVLIFLALAILSLALSVIYSKFYNRRKIEN